MEPKLNTIEVRNEAALSLWTVHLNYCSFKCKKGILPNTVILRRGISKWSKYGHTCLVPPDIEPMVDITVYMDVAINPGPEEKTITSHREGIVNVNQVVNCLQICPQAQGTLLFVDYLTLEELCGIYAFITKMYLILVY